MLLKVRSQTLERDTIGDVGREPSGNFVYHGTKSPDINFFAIAGSSIKKFRCHPMWCTNDGGSLVELVLDDTGNTKVAKLKTALFCNQDVRA
jgi:hypothetical protein